MFFLTIPVFAAPTSREDGTNPQSKKTIPLKTLLLEEFDICSTSHDSSSIQEDWITGVYGEAKSYPQGLFTKPLEGFKIDFDHQRPYEPDMLPAIKRSEKGKGRESDRIFPIPVPPAAMIASVTAPSDLKNKVRNFFRGPTISASAKGFLNMPSQWEYAEVTALKKVGLLVESGQLATWPVNGQRRPVIVMRYKGKPLHEHEACYWQPKWNGADGFEWYIKDQLYPQLKQEVWRLIERYELLHFNPDVKNIVFSANEKCEIDSVRITNLAYPNVFVVKIPKGDKGFEQKFDVWFRKRFEVLYPPGFASGHDPEDFLVASPSQGSSNMLKIELFFVRDLKVKCNPAASLRALGNERDRFTNPTHIELMSIVWILGETVNPASDVWLFTSRAPYGFLVFYGVSLREFCGTMITEQVMTFSYMLRPVLTVFNPALFECIVNVRLEQKGSSHSSNRSSIHPAPCTTYQQVLCSSNSANDEAVFVLISSVSAAELPLTFSE
ncbi:hypothetical protein EV360DRAFT_72037 [Lentinula raphanica]|nr:hypothetical protein EV360DRAFT_72037 [Lentinula raphanica]